jgi:hypothetical protein
MPEYIPLLGASRFEVVGELAVATRTPDSGVSCFCSPFLPQRVRALKRAARLYMYMYSTMWLQTPT